MKRKMVIPCISHFAKMSEQEFTEKARDYFDNWDRFCIEQHLREIYLYRRKHPYCFKPECEGDEDALLFFINMIRACIDRNDAIETFNNCAVLFDLLFCSEEPDSNITDCPITAHKKWYAEEILRLRNKKAADTRHAARQEIFGRAKAFVEYDLAGNCNPEWTTADYFNHLRNDIKNNKRDADANLLVSDEALKKMIIAIFKERGLHDRIAKGPARHVKLRK